MPPLLADVERVEAEIVAIKKKIADRVKMIHDLKEETKEIERQTRIMRTYGLEPTTGQKRQRVEVQVVESSSSSSSSSDELQCAGCSSCRGPLASDAEDADDEYDDAGDGIAAASSKNS